MTALWAFLALLTLSAAYVFGVIRGVARMERRLRTAQTEAFFERTEADRIRAQLQQSNYSLGTARTAYAGQDV